MRDQPPVVTTATATGTTIPSSSKTTSTATINTSTNTNTNGNINDTTTAMTSNTTATPSTSSISSSIYIPSQSDMVHFLKSSFNYVANKGIGALVDHVPFGDLVVGVVDSLISLDRFVEIEERFGKLRWAAHEEETIEESEDEIVTDVDDEGIHSESKNDLHKSKKSNMLSTTKTTTSSTEKTESQQSPKKNIDDDDNSFLFHGIPHSSQNQSTRISNLSLALKSDPSSLSDALEKQSLNSSSSDDHDDSNLSRKKSHVVATFQLGAPSTTATSTPTKSTSIAPIPQPNPGSYTSSTPITITSTSSSLSVDNDSSQSSTSELVLSPPPPAPTRILRLIRSIDDMSSEIPFRPLSPQPSTSATLLKKSKRRVHIIKEIISTEETYVDALTALNDIYIAPLEASDLLTSEESLLLFGNMKSLLFFQKFCVLPDLIKASNVNPPNIGGVFKTHSPLFKLYTTYLTNLSLSLAFLAQPSRVISSHTRRRRLKSFLISARNHPKHSQISLEAFLLLPMQRLPRYRMLLESLLEVTEENELDSKGNNIRNILREGLDEIRRRADECNEKKREWESKVRGEEILKSLKGGKGKSLMIVGRVLIKEGSFKILNGSTNQGNNSNNSNSNSNGTNSTGWLGSHSPSASVTLSNNNIYPIFLFTDLILQCKQIGSDKKHNTSFELMKCIKFSEWDKEPAVLEKDSSNGESILKICVGTNNNNGGGNGNGNGLILSGGENVLNDWKKSINSLWNEDKNEGST